MMRILLIALLLSTGHAIAAEPVDKDKYILELEKTVAELQMESLKRQYLDVRVLWKEKLKALGLPDPDVKEEEKKK